MKAQIVWGGERLFTKPGASGIPDVNVIAECSFYDGDVPYLLLPVTFEDGEPVVHGPWDTLHNVEDADEGVNMCLEWCGDLLTLARQAREE